MKRVILMSSLLFSFGEFVAMNQSKQPAKAQKQKDKSEVFQEELVCHLWKPIHTVLLYGTAMYCDNVYKQGVFLTVFGPDNVGEVYLADDCSRALKSDVLWTNAHESRRGEPIDIRQIKIGNECCSLKIHIVDEERGIIKVLKERIVPIAQENEK